MSSKTGCRLAILGSGNGTNMLSLIAAIQAKRLAARIEVVISNRQEALILTRAREHHIPGLWLNTHSLDRVAADEKLSELLQPFAIDLIVLVGYMRILSAPFVKRWQDKIINVHPSLLPAFAGGMDRQVHQAVLEAGAQESGCTVHLVTETVDAGPIVVQKCCPVHRGDTIESLRARVQALEGVALIEAIQQIA